MPQRARRAAIANGQGAKVARGRGFMPQMRHFVETVRVRTCVALRAGLTALHADLSISGPRQSECGDGCRFGANLSHRQSSVRARR
ncbi:MAG: hypothetical protein RL186_620 [Pseudomonadota bacterium]